ncbi:MAG TPA: response regulator transcription factor [Steroidobacteraceae bacterium]|nr:response regulator transcription factor [Steroidobacteraceae bacterium]
MRRKTRILVIDGEGLARDGLCALLEGEADLHLVGVFASAREALRAHAEIKPDVAIVDLCLAMRSGPQTLVHLKRRWGSAAVLVLSASRDGETIEAARRAGADGYVLRNDRRSELFNAIKTLAQKKHYISTSVLETAAPRRSAPHARGTDGAGMLTSREQEVVALIAEGYRTREMAQLLSVSHKTIERHRTNLMRKLGVRSATGVVAYAITHGYVGF